MVSKGGPRAALTDSRQVRLAICRLALDSGVHAHGEPRIVAGRGIVDQFGRGETDQAQYEQGRRQRQIGDPRVASVQAEQGLFGADAAHVHDVVTLRIVPVGNIQRRLEVADQQGFCRCHVAGERQARHEQ